MSENKNYLNDQDYTKMMNSDYVKKWLNPRFPFQRDESERLKIKLDDKSHFTIKDSVPYWIIELQHGEKEFRPVPEDVALFARFLGRDIDIEKYRQVEQEHTAKIMMKRFCLVLNPVLRNGLTN